MIYGVSSILTLVAWSCMLALISYRNSLYRQIEPHTLAGQQADTHTQHVPGLYALFLLLTRMCFRPNPIFACETLAQFVTPMASSTFAYSQNGRTRWIAAPGELLECGCEGEMYSFDGNNGGNDSCWATEVRTPVGEVGEWVTCCRLVSHYLPNPVSSQCFLLTAA